MAYTAPLEIDLQDVPSEIRKLQVEVNTKLTVDVDVNQFLDAGDYTAAVNLILVACGEDPIGQVDSNDWIKTLVATKAIVDAFEE